MAAFTNPPIDMYGAKLPIVQCSAEIKRRDGVYGFKGCKRNATQRFQYRVGAGLNRILITMHYCTRHAYRGQQKEDAQRRAA